MTLYSAVGDRLRNTRRLAVHFGWTEEIRRKRESIDWGKHIPFFLMQASPLAIFFVGTSKVAVAVCLLFWFVRKFAITGFYHRYFSHKAFKAGRTMQFVMAAWGGAAVQKGALWWAAHHREHHRVSDQPEDIHSPVAHGFWWSHMGWIVSQFSKGTELKRVKELARFPELKFLDKHHWIMPVLSGAAMFGLGAWLERVRPDWGTSGSQMLVWGFFVSTVILYHTTYSINSLTHIFGSRRFETKDQSRNHWLLALITLGEGWHNNHHFYPSSARMGFRWWEYDITYWGLWLMEKLRLIHDLRPVPPQYR
jgi:stearoyl-CoA desaturase (delta-9 desaturase)